MVKLITDTETLQEVEGLHDDGLINGRIGWLY